ncbi:MAG: hypothetical protein V2A73_01305 [Pseudomonadota bacterium]
MLATVAAIQQDDVPTSTTIILEEAISELVQLQQAAAEIDRKAKMFRREIRAALAVLNLRKHTTQDGHSAVLVDSTSWRADRAAAERLLAPAIVAEVFKRTSTTTLRVK